MAGSKRTTTRIGHLSLQQETSKNHLMIESLLSNNTSNRFQFIMTPTRGKTCSLCRRDGRITLPSRKPRTVDNMLL